MSPDCAGGNIGFGGKSPTRTDSVSSEGSEGPNRYPSFFLFPVQVPSPKPPKSTVPFMESVSTVPL